MTEEARSEGSWQLPAPWDRIFSLSTRFFVWVLIFAIIYILRSFFLLVFLTFVFAYIQAHGVHVLSPYLRNRALTVWIVGILFLGIIWSIGYFLAPRVRDQAFLFANRFPIYIQTIDDGLFSLAGDYPVLQSFFPEAKVQPAAQNLEDAIESWVPGHSPTVAFLQQFFGFGERGAGEVKLERVLDLLRGIGKYLVAIASAFLLSLLFSFLIVLDLPRLTKSVTSLADTKLAFIYREVAGNIRNFGLVLGRALEAQLGIALVNTLLTAILLYLLGLGGKIAFLCIIVFLCSFIPVAGVFISSVPICLVALQEAGLNMVLLAILCIWIIHMVEGYILNPLIYGERMRMNPVLVLVILTICGKLFHIWGLVLSIPICTYFFGHAIQYKPKVKKRMKIRGKKSEETAPS